MFDVSATQYHPEPIALPGSVRVSFSFRLGQIPGMRIRTQPGKQGLSLMELLCVIAIIAILAAMYMGTISKAFLHVKKVLGK